MRLHQRNHRSYFADGGIAFLGNDKTIVTPRASVIGFIFKPLGSPRPKDAYFFDPDDPFLVARLRLTVVAARVLVPDLPPHVTL